MATRVAAALAGAKFGLAGPRSELPCATCVGASVRWMLVVLSNPFSALDADASITSDCGFDAACAAMARGFVNGITLGGGVVPCAARTMEGIDP